MQQTRASTPLRCSQKGSLGQPRDAKFWTFNASWRSPGKPEEDSIATLARAAAALTAAGAAALFLVVSGPAAARAASATESCFQATVNAERAASGLPLLASDPTLVGIAEGWAGTMAQTGIFEHNPNLGADLPPVWRTYGENVGQGASCSSIASAFFGSPEHRANILDPDYSVIGVGVVVTGDGTIYVAEDFAGPGGGVPAAGSAPGAPATAPPPAAPATSTTPAAPKAAPKTPSKAAAQAAAPRPSPSPFARHLAASARVMIEPVSNITASGAVVPISATAPPPAPQGRSAGSHHAPVSGKKGILRRLRRDLRHFISHLVKPTPHASIA